MEIGQAATRHTWHCPFTLLDHRLHDFNDTWVGLGNIFSLANNKWSGCGQRGGGGEEKESTTNCELLKRTRVLDIGKSFVKLLELNINFLLRLLCLGDLKNKQPRIQQTTGAGRKREQLTALTSNVSMALMCALTSYVVGLKSFNNFSASSTMALFFNTER